MTVESNGISSLRIRLEKLVRTYDSTTMKIFITIECIGEDLVCAHYNSDRRIQWENFLERREACRLDLSGHQKLKDKYEVFMLLPKEERGKQIHSALSLFFHSKGAVDYCRQLTMKNSLGNSNKRFAGQVVKMFEKKLDGWFTTFEAVAVKLTGHVKVSGYVRVLTGQADAICRRDNSTYILDIKVTTADSPRPMDVVHLCLLKMLTIQNGLEDPNNLRLGLLVLHLDPSRPVLRLWEYDPTPDMERALREGDIDKLIEAGKLSSHHELCKGNMFVIETTKLEHIGNMC